MTDLTPADRARAFCRWYLATIHPGPTTRTVPQLARDMPPWFVEQLAQFAPHLADHASRAAKRRAAVLRAMASLSRAEAALAKELGAWIDGKPAPAPRPPRPTRVTPRRYCTACSLDYAITLDGRMRPHHGITRAGFSTGRPCAGVGKPPKPGAA